MSPIQTIPANPCLTYNQNYKCNPVTQPQSRLLNLPQLKQGNNNVNSAENLAAKLCQTSIEHVWLAVFEGLQFGKM